MKKNSSYKSFKNFKVLLVYPNIQMCEMMPYSMGLLTALLRREGFQVDLFDSTFYFMTSAYRVYKVLENNGIKILSIYIYLLY